MGRRYWQPLAQSLATDYPGLALDLRGFGDSPPGNRSSTTGDSPYRLLDYAEDIVALLEALDIKQAWLVGHSLGGSIA
ncbi:MAG: alpha/beta fold hydrolase, partial [Microcystaceae cyanobacterium]